MAIADDTAEGVFVCFDGVMTKLHNLKAKEAGEMLIEDGVNPEDSHVPPFIAYMEGKTYTFQVGVTTYTFAANHQTFTITRIMDGGDPMPVPAFVNYEGDNDDGDDPPDGTPVPTESGSGVSCEASVNATANKSGEVSRKPMGSVSIVVKKARVA